MAAGTRAQRCARGVVNEASKEHGMIWIDVLECQYGEHFFGFVPKSELQFEFQAAWSSSVFGTCGLLKTSSVQWFDSFARRLDSRSRSWLRN